MHDGAVVLSTTELLLTRNLPCLFVFIFFYARFPAFPQASLLVLCFAAMYQIVVAI